MKITNKKQMLLVLTALTMTTQSLAQTNYTPSWGTAPAPTNVNPANPPMPAGDVGVLYTQIGSQGLWYGNSQNTARLRQLLNFLPQIESHGLKVNDYKLSYWASMLSQNPVAVDIELTKEVLKLLKDVRVGRVKPTSVSDDVKFAQRRFDIDQKVIDFINYPSASSFNALAPQHRLYRDLAEALQKLRTINSRGGYAGVQSLNQTIRLGSVDPAIYQMKIILNIFGFNLYVDDYFDASFEAAIKKIQQANLGQPDGIISPRSKDALAYFRMNSFERQQEVELMMEKIRWLPEYLGEKFIFLNIANQELSVVDPKLEASSPIRLQRVVVGRVSRKTPSMADKVTHVVINPTWTVPPGILAADKLPALRSAFVEGGYDGIQSYLDRQRFSLLDRVTQQPIDITFVDWMNVTAQDAPFKIVQATGLDNALGVMKFMLGNPYNIYLHDTNERGLFKLFDRMRSSGCVRVENYLELAAYLLQGSKWDYSKLQSRTAREGEVGIEQEWVKIAPEMKLPVYMLPITAYKKDNEFLFTKDVYGQNAALLRALKRAGYYTEASPATPIY
jgi:L,D-transpeptidase YcbB